MAKSEERPKPQTPVFVQTRVPLVVRDKLAARALREGITLSSYVRRLLLRDAQGRAA